MADISMFQSAADLAYCIELIEENRNVMTAAARSILTGGYAGYVDDAVQNACISMAENISSIKNRLKCSKRCAFCVRVVKNKSIDIIRRNSKAVQQPLDDVAFALESETPDPLDTVLESEGYEQLIRAIDSLDENYSTVLKYKLVDGFSDAEIAGILGITPKNANVRACRAKKKLRQILSACRTAGAIDVSGLKCPRGRDCKWPYTQYTGFMPSLRATSRKSGEDLK